MKNLSYQKIDFINGETALNQENMGKMDQAIYDIVVNMNELLNIPDAETTKFPIV